jgi:hypothetical protein
MKNRPGIALRARQPAASEALRPSSCVDVGHRVVSHGAAPDPGPTSTTVGTEYGAAGEDRARTDGTVNIAPEYDDCRRMHASAAWR